jgi:hypothetical protein
MRLALFVVALLGLVTSRTGAQARDPRATIFVARGCNQCHGIRALGVKSKSDVGPDLTFAYADVVNRYGMSLAAFLNDPSGVMRLMLASHLHLTLEDRDSIARVLQRVCAEHVAELKDEVPPIARATPESGATSSPGPVPGQPGRGAAVKRGC